MDSYPYQMNQIPPVPYYYPSGQILRPQSNMNPARFMAPYESLPFGGYGYPGSHGYCYPNFQPTYCAFRPPYAHIAPYPFNFVLPGQHPFHYVPPPYFSMGQPHYEFQKNFPAEHHCCGCVNHPFKQNETKNAKIEEQHEDMDRKNDLMVPFNARNHPYPVGWFPYGDVCKDHAKPYKTEHKEQEEVCNEAKPPCDLGLSEQPIVWNGWSPVNMNMKTSEGMKKGGDLLTDQQKHDDNSMPFPFPMFWMPYQQENSPKMERPWSDFGQNSDQMVHKVSTPKVIPVKQLEENDTKGTSNETKGKSTNASAKPKNGNGDKKINENVRIKVSSSKNLAPVCLRVDPLPRKKGHKGGSRSPSPPGAKGVIEGTTQGDTQKDVNVGCVISTSENDNQIGSVGVEAPFGREKRKTCSGESILCDNTECQTKTRIKRDLSEDEAATKIQSAYRGFEVRKWEPLKKIKQISNIREQMGEIRSHIQALEHSSDKQVDNKQKNVIAETIMSLLLNLDTIQGLHPCVRDIRKSVARELVSLQERLDSITERSAEQSLTAEDGMRVDENGAVVQGHTNTMEQPENSHIMNGQGNDEQIDGVFAESPTSMELEAKEIIELEQCLSSPHQLVEGLTNCDAEKTTNTSVAELSQGAHECSFFEDMNHDVKDLEEVAQDKILNCVEKQVVLTVGNLGGMNEEGVVFPEPNDKPGNQENEDLSGSVHVDQKESDTKDGKEAENLECCMEENEKLRKRMDELIESGKEQLTTISALCARVHQLEKRLLHRRKKLKMRKHRAALPKFDPSEKQICNVLY